MPLKTIPMIRSRTSRSSGGTTMVNIAILSVVVAAAGARGSSDSPPPPPPPPPPASSWTIILMRLLLLVVVLVLPPLLCWMRTDTLRGPPQHPQAHQPLQRRQFITNFLYDWIPPLAMVKVTTRMTTHCLPQIWPLLQLPRRHHVKI